MATSIPPLSAPIPKRPANARSSFTLGPSSSSSSSSLPSPPPANNNNRRTSDDNSDSDADDDDAPLPFPAALPRSDFLSPTFNAPSYLSSLPHRHQTLEDLRSDLRERSAAIGFELLELVNANYASFLGLGDELRGGEERVEDVRVALLGFRRAVEEIRSRVKERGQVVRGLNKELGDVRAEIEVGRKMLELDERIGALEGWLAIGMGSLKGAKGEDSDEDEDDYDDDDEEEEEGLVGSSAAKLTRLATELVTIDELADEIGRDAPFVRRTEERVIRCRNTLLLDLNAALKEVKKVGVRGRPKLLKLMGVYVMLDAQTEAVKALKA
ncbi:oligomeric golgi complex component, COG2-domain-containing protein [Xylariaceae sp. FL0255]|nr:oligomeric golgi complex component, COG2-domain-containing protein [Xylariaceae sp. FL0255]